MNTNINHFVSDGDQICLQKGRPSSGGEELDLKIFGAHYVTSTISAVCQSLVV